MGQLKIYSPPILDTDLSKGTLWINLAANDTAADG